MRAKAHATIQAGGHMWERFAGSVGTPAQQADPGWAALTQAQAGRTPLQADRAALHSKRKDYTSIQPTRTDEMPQRITVRKARHC